MGKQLQWKIHIPNLLQRIADIPAPGVLRVPLNLFGKALADVAERAAEINDPHLNAMMMRLTLYSVADPHSPDYDLAIVNKVMSKHRKLLGKDTKQYETKQST
jgi:hypothetical protein